MKNRCIFYSIVFFLGIVSRLFAGEPNMPFSLEKVSKKLEKIFSEHLQKRTNRRSILVVIEHKIVKEDVFFFPSKRNEREMILSLKVCKEEGMYKVQGKWFPRIPEEDIQSLFMEEFTEEEVSFDLQHSLEGYGIVNVPCADIYVNPIAEQGDNLASQLLYGVPVIILESNQDRSFLRIRSEQDGYIGWISSQNIEKAPKNIWEQWRYSPKVYLQEQIESFFPGTTLLFVQEECFSFSSQEGNRKKIQNISKNSSPATPEDILRTAKKFLEREDWKKTTYLWGGACIPKLDCSGFVQMVFRMNNILLPRDSDQQCQFSIPVSKDQLQKGDLVFFSKHGRHPTHVGIYLGDGYYIHCSPAGEHSGIKINRFHGESDYEKSLDQIYFASGRILK